MKRNVEGIDEKLKGGLFVDKHGKILGKHSGYPFYTIGQRKGLEITLGKPAFVTAIDPLTNTVVLGDEDDLLKNEMQVGQVNMIKYDHIEDGMESIVKIRYKDAGNQATLFNEGKISVCIFMTMPKASHPDNQLFFMKEMM